MEALVVTVTEDFILSHCIDIKTVKNIFSIHKSICINNNIVAFNKDKKQLTEHYLDSEPWLEYKTHQYLLFSTSVSVYCPDMHLGLISLL